MELSDKLKTQLNTWADVMKPLVESSEWDQLYANLKATVKSGKLVIPKSDEVWKSLQLCDRSKLKAVIVLQCPYATKRNEVVIADGIPMNCQNIAPYKQPSLYQWEQALEQQYGFDPDNDLRCNLQYLIEEEHVLLINSSLTVEYMKVDSHSLWWEPIMKYVIEEVIGKLYKGLPICLLGSQAQKLEKYINPMVHYIKKVEHPAAAAHQNRNWAHQDMHKWINEIIKQNNGESEMIQWLRKKGETKKVKESLPDWVLNKADGTPHTAKELNLPWND